MKCCRTALSLLVVLGGLSVAFHTTNSPAAIVASDGNGLLPSDACTATFRMNAFCSSNEPVSHEQDLTDDMLFEDQDKENYPYQASDGNYGGKDLDLYDEDEMNNKGDWYGDDRANSNDDPSAMYGDGDADDNGDLYDEDETNDSSSDMYDDEEELYNPNDMYGDRANDYGDMYEEDDELYDVSNIYGDKANDYGDMYEVNDNGDMYEDEDDDELCDTSDMYGDMYDADDDDADDDDDEGYRGSDDLSTTDDADQFTRYSLISSDEPTLTPSQPTRTADETDYYNDGQNRQDGGQSDRESEADEAMNSSNPGFDDASRDTSDASSEGQETEDDFAAATASQEFAEEPLLEKAVLWAEHSLSLAGAAIRNISDRLYSSDEADFSAEPSHEMSGYTGSTSDDSEF
jgi:hypothetical protein